MHLKLGLGAKIKNQLNILKQRHYPYYKIGKTLDNLSFNVNNSRKSPPLSFDKMKTGLK